MDDTEIDYEDLDDLALSDHIEWNHIEPEISIVDLLDPLFW